MFAQSDPRRPQIQGRPQFQVRVLPERIAFVIFSRRISSINEAVLLREFDRFHSFPP
jgi:hypothetical protein